MAPTPPSAKALSRSGTTTGQPTLAGKLCSYHDAAEAAFLCSRDNGWSAGHGLSCAQMLDVSWSSSAANLS